MYCIFKFKALSSEESANPDYPKCVLLTNRISKIQEKNKNHNGRRQNIHFPLCCLYSPNLMNQASKADSLLLPVP